jgi:hypothetical protein
MRTPLHGLLLAGLMMVSVPAAAQTDSQDHDAHHPEQTQDTPQPAEPGMPQGESGTMGGSGMTGMMSPEMMQMMMRMMMGQPGDSTGQPGMMGRNMLGRNMMDGSMMGGDMMADMMRGGMMMQMMGAMQSGAALHDMMAGHHLALGLPVGTPEEMTPERVRTFLEERLARLGNPRLKLGEIVTAEDGSITAEIVTVEGSLVQKLAFNRYPGLVRQITE